ncbi:hypothetical protein [Burkholderia sp. 8Y]|uniref:hypothetical protein n=1 Tax=Burkholderia sp. 8Y TaxID=2653133 RepID=UPI001359565D|nr:hypothetical protein [Burkholderia sp. 8Y]
MVAVPRWTEVRSRPRLASRARGVRRRLPRNVPRYRGTGTLPVFMVIEFGKITAVRIELSIDDTPIKVLLASHGTSAIS